MSSYLNIYLRVAPKGEDKGRTSSGNGSNVAVGEKLTLVEQARADAEAVKRGEILLLYSVSRANDIYSAFSDYGSFNRYRADYDSDNDTDDFLVLYHHLGISDLDHMINEERTAIDRTNEHLETVIQMISKLPPNAAPEVYENLGYTVQETLDWKEYIQGRKDNIIFLESLRNLVTDCELGVCDFSEVLINID